MLTEDIMISLFVKTLSSIVFAQNATGPNAGADWGQTISAFGLGGVNFWRS
jgi:hypothetical protein